MFDILDTTKKEYIIHRRYMNYRRWRVRQYEYGIYCSFVTHKEWIPAPKKTLL